MTRNIAEETATRWLEENAAELSKWTSDIWHLAETAWREYESAAWYVGCLRAEGFEVEAGSGGMPTAFAASWTNGVGRPAIATYAEYDAVPGNCQAASTVKAPRTGLNEYAGGHTDPHSALGTSAFPEFAGIVMASCDSIAERVQANMLGFRTFRVAPATGWSKEHYETLCPASEQAVAGKKTTCAECRACGGTSSRARCDIVIPAHGSGAKRVRG